MVCASQFGDLKFLSFLFFVISQSFESIEIMKSFTNFIAVSQRHFINVARAAILMVMVRIGGLKIYQYEADGIVPFVANSPLMSFFYAKRGSGISGI